MRLAMKGVSWVAADGSPEWCLRRMDEAQHLRVALVHGRTRKQVNKVRRTKGSKRNKRGKGVTPCTRRKSTLTAPMGGAPVSLNGGLEASRRGGFGENGGGGVG